MILIFVAGLLTSISPCVLPVIPLVFGSALRERKFGPLALILGLTSSYIALAWAISAAGSQINLNQETIRQGGAWLILGASIAMLAPASWFTAIRRPFQRIAGAADKKMNRVTAAGTEGSFAGQYLLGALLGAVWTPCAGPALGAALGIAVESGGGWRSLELLLIFGLGAALPLLVLAYGLKGAMRQRAQSLRIWSIRGRQIFGVVLLLVAVGTLTGGDHWVESHILDHLPAAWLELLGSY